MAYTPPLTQNHFFFQPTTRGEEKGGKGKGAREGGGKMNKQADEGRKEVHMEVDRKN
jgi:hypothetical protein